MPQNSSKVWEIWHCNSCLSQNADRVEHPHASEDSGWLWWQSVIGFVLLLLKEIWYLCRQEVHWEWLVIVYYWLPWLFFEQIMSSVNDKYLYSSYRFSSTNTLNIINSFPSSEFSGLQIQHEVCQYVKVRNKKLYIVWIFFFFSQISLTKN